MRMLLIASPGAREAHRAPLPVERWLTLMLTTPPAVALWTDAFQLPEYPMLYTVPAVDPKTAKYGRTPLDERPSVGAKTGPVLGSAGPWGGGFSTTGILDHESYPASGSVLSRASSICKAIPF